MFTKSYKSRKYYSPWPTLPSFLHSQFVHKSGYLFSLSKQHYLNYTSEPREITTSDNFSLLFKLFAVPFVIEKPKEHRTHKVDWDLFQQKLDSQIIIINFEESTAEEIERALTPWTNVVKNAMDTVIPKSNYQCIYQFETTPEIRALENHYRTLIEFATYFGWTMQAYTEFQRIKTKLR